MKPACVILAAGSGTRMNIKGMRTLPKVLHPLYGRPMLGYVTDAAAGLRPEKIVVVIGKSHGLIKESIENSGLSFEVQSKALGTADALSSGLNSLKGFKGTVLVLNGDMPLIRAGTLKKFLSLHRRHKNALSVASFAAREPFAYGRILRGKDGRAERIVEAPDADETEKSITEVNSGLYAIEPEAIGILKRIKKNRNKGEYYITDLFELTVKHGLRAEAYPIGDESEFIGVNTRLDLLKAQEALRKRVVHSLIQSGVVFLDEGSVFIHPTASVGAGSVLYPNVHIEGDTKIGKGCTIFPNSRITDSVIKDNAVIKDSTLIEESFVGREARVGPFAHLRPGSVIGDGARIGNFVETKKSSIGKGAKAMHLSYIGDAEVGAGVNIGAGTITCNFDGYEKHRTVIEDGVFIGSDSQLVAPIRVGKNAYVGAGSTITEDVPKGSLAVSRTRQKTIPDWSRMKKLRKLGSKDGQ